MKQATAHGDRAWLVDASYVAGQVMLNLIGENSLVPFQWSDSSFHPYYLTEEDAIGERITKSDLFTQNEHSLYKVNAVGAMKNVTGWETDIDPALSYVYDRGLRFGVLHRSAQTKLF